MDERAIMDKCVCSYYASEQAVSVAGDRRRTMWPSSLSDSIYYVSLHRHVWKVQLPLVCRGVQPKGSISRFFFAFARHFFSGCLSMMYCNTIALKKRLKSWHKHQLTGEPIQIWLKVTMTMYTYTTITQELHIMFSFNFKQMSNRIKLTEWRYLTVYLWPHAKYFTFGRYWWPSPWAQVLKQWWLRSSSLCTLMQWWLPFHQELC